MKNFYLILLSLSFLLGHSQRKTTSVKGYYRKNGTYVKPHTRSYNSSSSNYSYGSGYSAENNTNDSIKINNLSLMEINSSEIKKGKTRISNLKKVSDENEGVIFYVSVLRYNGMVIDICPIKRDYSNNWDFDNVKHIIDKNLITPEEALKLVSEYKWSISKNNLEKDFYKYIKYDLPDFLQKNIEALKVE